MTLSARRYASAGISYGPVSVCVRLCLSVTSLCSIETDEQIGLVFGTSYSAVKGNSSIFKNKGTSLWNFAPNSGLRKFRHGISIVEARYQLCSRKVDAQSVINWAVVGQLRVYVDNTSELRRSTNAFYRTVKLCLRHEFVTRVN